MPPPPVTPGRRVARRLDQGVHRRRGLVALYWRNLDRLWDKTNPISGDPNWYHAICVP
jgi:hypothetical protein